MSFIFFFKIRKMNLNELIYLCLLAFIILFQLSVGCFVKSKGLRSAARKNVWQSFRAGFLQPGIRQK